MPGCIDDIFKAGGFDEQVLAAGKHLVMNQRMRTPEVLAEVIDGSTNLRQFDLILASQRIQDMRFGEVAERQSRVRRIGEFDHATILNRRRERDESSRTGAQRITSEARSVA